MKLFRTAALILALLLFTAGETGTALAARRQEPDLADPAYTFCEKTEECLTVRPACSAPIVVNLMHHEEVQNWFDYIRPHVKCAEGLLLPEVKNKACIKNRCTLELTPPKVPEPDNSPQAKDMHYCDKDSECVVVLGDCCEKNFVNTKNARRLRAEIQDNALLATCFYPDRRHVKNLRCEKHQCTADLEAPLELRDPTHSTKMRCEQ